LGYHRQAAYNLAVISRHKEQVVDHTEILLKEITEVGGVPGYEHEVRSVMRQYIEDVAVIEQDRMGSFIGKHVGDDKYPRVMLAGHMDEIGFMVKLITKEGFVKFQALGGWWDQVLLGHRVLIRTAKGDVIGVLGAKPPHLLEAEERKKVVEKKDMYIDVGARSEDEVREMGVRPGDPIIPVSEFTVMANPGVYLSKAFDNQKRDTPIPSTPSARYRRKLACEGPRLRPLSLSPMWPSSWRLISQAMCRASSPRSRRSRWAEARRCSSMTHA
jgi:hypothetical protein